MIKCAKCSKENQDHYKFCLGCGSELPKDAPKQFQAEATHPPPEAVMSAPVVEAPAVEAPVVAAPLKDDAPAEPEAAPAPPEVAPEPVAPEPVADAAPAPAAPEPAAAEPVATSPGACPQCGHANPDGNRFCAACGYKLEVAGNTAATAPAAEAEKSGVTLTALRADGSEAGVYELPAGPAATVGRDTGTIFAGDSYLSPRHATFGLKDGAITVRDEGSLNGVYVKLTVDEPFLLEPNSVFRIGQEIIRFEPLEREPAVEGVEKFGSPSRGIVGRLALVIGRDTTGNAFPIPARGLHLGRERGDVLFSEDGYVSGLHCLVAPGPDGKVYLTDVGSSNGTFVRVRDNHPINSGDILLMGQQVFRFDVAK